MKYQWTWHPTLLPSLATLSRLLVSSERNVMWTLRPAPPSLRSGAGARMIRIWEFFYQLPLFSICWVVMVVPPLARRPWERTGSESHPFLIPSVQLRVPALHSISWNGGDRIVWKLFLFSCFNLLELFLFQWFIIREKWNGTRRRQKEAHGIRRTYKILKSFLSLMRDDQTSHNTWLKGEDND